MKGALLVFAVGAPALAPAYVLPTGRRVPGVGSSSPTVALRRVVPPLAIDGEGPDDLDAGAANSAFLRQPPTVGESQDGESREDVKLGAAKAAPSLRRAASPLAMDGNNNIDHLNRGAAEMAGLTTTAAGYLDSTLQVATDVNETKSNRTSVSEIKVKAKAAVDEVKAQVKEKIKDPWPLFVLLILWTWPWLLHAFLKQMGDSGMLRATNVILPQLVILRTACTRLLLAAVCGAIIGLERKDADRPAGLRSLTLVSTGAALYVLACMCSTDIAGRSDASRSAAQVCTGVGFIGAGVISQGSGNDPVRGVTTACAVWVAAAVGVVAAAGLPLFALYATGLTVTILRVSRWYNDQIKARLQALYGVWNRPTTPTASAWLRQLSTWRIDEDD